MADHNAPPWVLILVALIGAIGVVLAAVLSRPEREAAPTATANAIAIAAPTLTSMSTQACVVPQVERLDQGAAEVALGQLGLQIVKSTQYNAEVASGFVLSQEPPAGKKLSPCRGDVVIVVSLGPTPTIAPPTRTPIQPTAIPLAPTPYSGLIPFVSPTDPGILNPILGWQPGGSKVNTYDLKRYPGALTLIAGPYTWQEQSGMPMIIYPVTGDFTVEIRLVFEITESSLFDQAHIAGLGIRPAQSQDPTTWLISGRGVGTNGQSVASYIYKGHTNVTKYSDNTVYIKVERRGTLFDSAYSTNGSNWITLLKNFVFEMPTDIELFLFTYSTDGTGVVARFYDFEVYHR